MEDSSHNLESREEALVNQEELSIDRFNLFSISWIGIARSRAALKTTLNNFLTTYQSTCINQASTSILKTQQSNWKKWKAALQRLEKKICVRIISRSKSEDQRHLLHFCFAKGLHCQTARLQKQHTHTHSDRQRQQQACESNRGSSKERRPGQRLCMGSNSSSSKERTEKRTGERKSGEQGRGCAWAESQRVRCCQQQQQRQERQQQ